MATPAAGGARPACTARGSVTLAASRTVRVYTLPKRDSEGRRRNFGALPGRTFGCRYSADKRISLGVSGDRVLGGFHIAGNFVAFTASGATAATETIEAVDLARGRMTLRDRVPNSGVPDLVIAQSGSLAWIRSTAAASTVVKYEAGTGKSTVDAGPAVGSHSLALGGPSFDRQSDTIYWTTPSGPKSAPLVR